MEPKSQVQLTIVHNMKWALISFFSIATVVLIQRFRNAKKYNDPAFSTIAAKFRRMRKQVLIILILTSFMGFVYGSAIERPMDNSRQLLDNFLFLILILIGVIFTFLGWRCPSCKKLLWKYVNPPECPFCKSSFKEPSELKSQL